MLEKKILRRNLIEKRNLLSPNQRLNASKLICQRLAHTLLFLRSNRIAFYFAQKGEVSTQQLFEDASDLNKECFFPVLHPLKNNQLWFQGFEIGDPLSINKFGILEPDPFLFKLTPTWSLDLVITPLVGFDLNGNRLGMGGGYYDRTFNDCNSWGRRPKLVGLAYDFQCTDCLSAEHWDIPLDWVVTEKRIYKFSN